MSEHDHGRYWEASCMQARRERDGARAEAEALRAALEKARVTAMTMLLGGRVCEKSHRDGERNAHVHVEVVHEWAVALAPFARAALATPAAPVAAVDNTTLVSVSVGALAVAISKNERMKGALHEDDHAAAGSPCHTGCPCARAAVELVAALATPAPAAPAETEVRCSFTHCWAAKREYHEMNIRYHGSADHEWDPQPVAPAEPTMTGYRHAERCNCPSPQGHCGCGCIKPTPDPASPCGAVIRSLPCRVNGSDAIGPDGYPFHHPAVVQNRPEYDHQYIPTRCTCGHQLEPAR